MSYRYIFWIENGREKLILKIEDDGKGMNSKTLSEVSDPFFTTRTTRKVGLGISLFKMAAELCDGSLTIQSEEGKGTKIIALFEKNHINRAPLGAIEETILILCLNDKNIDIKYTHLAHGEYVFDTRMVKEVLNDIPLSDYNVMMWLKDNIKDGILSIQKEETK